MTGSKTLGARLQTVASFVPKGAKLGDIGTDHAYLPIVLYETQRISKAVAVDVHEGPYQSALATVKARQLEGVIDVRFGDGLIPIEPGEVNVLTLAGMGGRTMLDILSARPEVLSFVTDLIVQPQGAEGAIRLAMVSEGWRLKAEVLVEEEDRTYVVIAFSREEGWSMADLLALEKGWVERLGTLPRKDDSSVSEFNRLVHRLVWHFGPLVLEERAELLKSYLEEYIAMLVRRLEQMKKSNNPEIEDKLREVSGELDLVEGILTWQ